MRKQNPQLTRLALALHIAVALPITASAQQLIVTDGTARTASGTYDTGTTPGASNGFALGAANEGSAITGTGVSARTGGLGAHALFADQKGLIDLSDSAATSRGNDAFGVLAEDFGIVRLRNTDITATGTINGQGVVALNGGQVAVTNGSITSEGGAVAASGSGSLITINGTKVKVDRGASANHYGVAAQQGGVIRLGAGTTVETDSSGTHGLRAAGAGSQIHASGTAVTTGINFNSGTYGAVAIGGGLIDLTNGTTIATKSYQGAGLVAVDDGSVIQGNGVRVNVRGGEESHGIVAGAGGKITLSDVEIIADSMWSRGALAQEASTIDLTRFKTQSYERGATAITGGSVSLREGAMLVTGPNGVGLWADGSGSRIMAEKTALEGDGAGGVRATSGGQVAVDSGSSIAWKSQNPNDQLLYASGEGSTIEVVGTSLSSGVVGGTLAADGVLVENGARVNFSSGSTLEMKDTGDALVATGKGSIITAKETNFVMSQYTGTASVKIYDGARIELGPGTILTEKATGDLGYVVRLDGEGSYLSAIGTTFDSLQSPLNAIAVSNKAQAHLGEGTQVLSNALGLTVGASAKATLDKASIKTAREQGALIYGSLDMRDSAIETTDSGNYSALQLSTYYADEAKPITVNISGGNLTSAGGSAIRSYASAISPTETGAVVRLSNGTQLTGKDKLLAYVVDEGSLKLVVDDVDLDGNLKADRRSNYKPILDIELLNTSTLNGIIKDGTNLSIDPTSTWTLTGNSNLVSSLASAGSIAFAAPTSGDFKTLTVYGDYTGNGGSLAINTVLADDASATDKLVVEGNTSGNTTLRVNNVGGAGAPTAEGIQVVQVGGASNGTFALDGRAVAGAYEYRLAQGGVANPADGDWYLRSQALPPAPVPDPAPAPSPDPAPVPQPPAPAPDPVGPTPAPLYRPEAAAYLANQAAAVGMFQHSMHDRMGEPNFAPDDRAVAAWVRVARNQMDGLAGFDQLDVSTDTSLLQVGGELGVWSGDSRFHFGLMGGTGRADSHAGSSLTDYRSKGKATGYNLGIYATWFAHADEPAGLYVDGWLQYGRYDQEVAGDYLEPEKYDARTLSASAEAGYAFALGGGGRTAFFIEPQAQLIYTDYRMGTHQEANGTLVDDDGHRGLTSRLGMRFYGHAAQAAYKLVQPFATLNWWHDSDYNRMTFNGDAMELSLPRDRYELKLGIQAQLGGGWTGWGQMGALTGDDDYRDINGQFGLNYRW